jgi:hypothetical protein
VVFYKITLLKTFKIMPCGCQKNKGNTAAVNKAAATRPSKPSSNGRVVSGGSGRIEKRVIR